MEKIKNSKYERIDKIWRKSPAKLEECKMYETCSVMETLNAETGIDYVMPVISRKAFDQVDFRAATEFMERMYGEEVQSIKARTSDPVKRAKSAF